MRWTQKLSDGIKRGIRNWLNIQPANSYGIQITETADFELNAIRNRIWYRGDSNELEQLYQQTAEYADKYKFWACRSTPGMEIRKIHTGIPALIVKVLAEIVLVDLNDFEFEDAAAENDWKEIEKQNKFRKKLKRALQETLYIGDGAWKVTLDTKKSVYPYISWYSGDKIELVHDGDSLQEIIFKTQLKYNRQQYDLFEHYGYGYIHYELCRDGNAVDLNSIPQTQNLTDWKFDESLILAVHFQIYESAKWEGRGSSIFDSKIDSFDSLDEAWSQWIDALRAGRAKTYIPDCFVPRNPNTGEIMRPNPFDNRYLSGGNDMAEDGKNEIKTEQPAIPCDSYMTTFSNALDLCLQGLISPSTLGIDMKKLDNAEAQREKEKATLYTRNSIVEAMQDILPELVSTCINALQVLKKQVIKEVKVDIPFGEYANPSFESQVETVGKGKAQGIMSIEAAVEELYGDSRDEIWKSEEVKRLKQEQGITELEEPALNLEGVELDGSENRGEDMADEPKGIPAAPANCQ